MWKYICTYMSCEIVYRYERKSYLFVMMLSLMKCSVIVSFSLNCRDAPNTSIPINFSRIQAVVMTQSEQIVMSLHNKELREHDIIIFQRRATFVSLLSGASFVAYCKWCANSSVNVREDLPHHERCHSLLLTTQCQQKIPKVALF